MEIKNCTLLYDDKTETVTINHSKTGCQIIKIKLESAGIGTMTRVDFSGYSDSDNFWLGIKPADSVVFNNNLFGRNKLIVSNIEFKLKS